MSDEKSCKARVREELRGRIDDLQKLWTAEKAGDENGVEDLGTFNEYGLCFDYVPPGTFGGQRRGYFRYQLSWGGPADEFRFFVDENWHPTRIEYWFLDWYDGAKVTLREGTKDHALLMEIWGFFEDVESVKAAFTQANA